MAAQAPRVAVITGASGKLARRVAEIALESYRPQRLILVTRNPDALADLAERGPEIRFGDFADPKSLPDAFAGGERMLLVSTTDLARRNEEHSAAVNAAAAAGIAHVVYTSIVGADPPNPAVVAPGHYFTEQAIKRSGMKWTFLRNSLYADYQLPEALRAIKGGSFVHIRGAGRVAYVARDDCAAVAARVLMDGEHEGVVYDVTGPHAYDATELATLYGELGGHRVEAVALDEATFIAGLIAAGSGDDHARYGAELVTSFGRAIRGGCMASCTDTVAMLTGRPPRPLREMLAERLKSAKL